MPSRPLYKTTIVIWSEWNPSRYAGDDALEYLGRHADQGEAYCSKMSSEEVKDPKADPDWDGTEFFGVLEEEG